MLGKIMCLIGLHEEVKAWKTKWWQGYVCIRKGCEHRRRLTMWRPNADL